MRLLALAALTLVLALPGALAAADPVPAMVDNPAYKSWSAFKAGSWVRMRTESDAGAARSVVKVTTKLLSIDPQKAVVEDTAVVAMMGREMAQPAIKREIPAKVAPQSMGADAPKPKEGDEEITVGGKKMKAHWIEVVTEVSGARSTSKSWFVTEVPGGLAKMESTTTFGTTTTTSKSAVEEWKSA
jgi:hypothetical protein